VLRHRIARACIVSAALFAVSIAAPEPFRYVLWAMAIGIESGAMLNEDKEAARTARRERDFSALRPADPEEALDPHHFAERFGLFLIILLGEVVVEAGQASVDGHVATTSGWAALVAAMIFAGALWWLYFDSAADVNLKVLELSGGSPTMARAIFAVGHMLPSFALLIIAAGVGLLLEEDPPRIAYWLPCIGFGIYLLGTRVFLHATPRASGAARVLLLVVTFQLGRLDISPHAYLWLLAAWATMCAILGTRGSPVESDARAPAAVRGSAPLD
jgi:low temperature requirement protein LtrA